MGPSGCGKSTMLHMLGCLDNPDSGEIWLNGRRVDDLSTRATTKLLREEIGFIFQGFNLVPSHDGRSTTWPWPPSTPASRGKEAQKLARGGAGQAVGLARPGRPPADRAVRRAAAAGGHRPGAGEPARR